MPRRDLFHNAVKHALTKAGWVITHDPYVLRLLVFDPVREEILEWIE